MSSLAAVVLLIALFALSADSQSCTHASVRLVGGSGPYEGNVQVCNQGVWGWVCDNSWSTNDARVVCRQLGYSTSNTIPRPYSYYGWGNGTIWLDHMYCSGSEANLLACSHAYSVGVTYCGYGEMAGVYCHTLNSGQTCPEGQVRLSNLYQSSYGRSEGRVEYCHNNQWGTVCDDSWNSPDAQVTCFQLGYSRTGAQSFSWGYFGWGTGNIWLDNVACSGSENSLASCSKNCLGCHNCYHGEDAGVRCYSRDTSSCTNNQIKLWSAYGHTNEGILLICKNNAWTAACRYYYSCYIAKTVCQQLGYAGALGLRSNAGFYYGYYYNNDQYRYYCFSSHTSLSQCYNYYYSACGSYNDALGVVCLASSSNNTCTDGAVRLTGDGATASEGRVEYCYKGTWSPFCYLHSSTANLLCSALGYTQFSWGTIYNDERHNRSDTSSSFNYIYCSSSATQLSDCTVYTKGGGCYISTSTCSTEYGLRCYNPGQCTDGQVRLVNGAIQQEGRAEVCINGVWSAICQSGFNTIDGYVFCSQLGYNGASPTIYYNAQFGESTGPVGWSSVYCKGWEKTLHDCTKSVYPSFTCYPQYTVGLTCKEDCSNGDVRLLGGGFDNEGTVEVCYNNIWGLVSDSGWTSGDATVVCNQLGYTGGIAMPVTGSKYGKPNKTIHFRDVSCSGNELNLAECSKTVLSLANGKLALASSEAAGVDCIYDVPTDPPCIAKPVLNPGSDCEAHSVRLVTETGAMSTDAGRAEYCYNGIWTPFCKMDTKVGTVICRQMGYSVYSWATVQPGSFGVTTNYSLFDNITCTGSETNINQCTVNEAPDDCTPYCAITNIAVRCFDPNTVNCQEGSIRLAAGIIENEGRVEFCVNGVWGSVCDNGWDATDAHIVCTQLGHPELQPRLFTNSYFGGGNYPIIYSSLGCGGWEKNVVTDCNKDTYSDFFSCTRDNIAGVLCGYDCNDGDVRLVGGYGSYEGTVEICFENLWGLVAESGWGQTDAAVVCRQLGYPTEGSMFLTGSAYGKPAKTIHMTGVQCIGSEGTLGDCTYSTLSLEQGKAALQTTDVAGVKCYHPDGCVAPVTGGISCTDKELRLVGDNAQNGEGNVQYCYQGTWSPFCSLGQNEATVICRQLQFTDSELVSVFDDGRYGAMPNVSQFQNFSCSTDRTEFTLNDCNLVDDCQSKCQYPVGIRCSAPGNCMDGDVRLVNGSIAQEGRVEVCLNNVWGSLCGDGFDKSDAFVICRELGLGDFEPTVYTSSYFGSGTGPVLYSQLGCRGYETTLADCSKASYGSFKCSSRNIAGLVCQDSCTDGDIQLVGGNSSSAGTVEVCYGNIWGLIADRNWTDTNAQVVCRQLGYSTTGALARGGSYYGKPNKTVQLSTVRCTGSEQLLDDCQGEHVPPDSGRQLYTAIEAAGVTCVAPTLAAPAPTTGQQSSSVGSFAGLGVVGVALIVAILVSISLIAYIFVSQKTTKMSPQSGLQVRMSGLQEERGVQNPLALDENDEFSSVDKSALVNAMEKQ